MVRGCSVHFDDRGTKINRGTNKIIYKQDYLVSLRHIFVILSRAVHPLCATYAALIGGNFYTRYQVTWKTFFSRTRYLYTLPH